VELDRARELLLLVKLFAEAFREHLINPNVCEEAIVFLDERSAIFKLPKVSLQLVIADHLGDLWNVKVLDLVLERSLRVFHEDTVPGTVGTCREWVIDLDHRWTRGWPRWHLRQRKCKSNELVVFI